MNYLLRARTVFWIVSSAILVNSSIEHGSNGKSQIVVDDISAKEESTRHSRISLTSWLRLSKVSNSRFILVTSIFKNSFSILKFMIWYYFFKLHSSKFVLVHVTEVKPGFKQLSKISLCGFSNGIKSFGVLLTTRLYFTKISFTLLNFYSFRILNSPLS